MDIDIWTDIICPFCYIGKHQLESALKAPGAPEATVRYRSFELNPNALRFSGDLLPAYLSAKLGVDPARVESMHDHVRSMGQEVGITFDFDHAKPTNSFDAHRLSHLARVRSREDEMVESLHRAFFIDGEDIGDVETLLRLATDVGLNPEEVRDVLGGDWYADAVRADEAMAVEYGISGVPYAVVDGHYGISGAQGTETLLHALQTIAWEHPAHAG